MKLAQKLSFIIVLCSATVACAQGPNKGALMTLTLELELDQGALANGNLIVGAALANSGTEPILILPWNTPLEGKLYGDFMTVIQKTSGKQLQYRGLMVKRAAPRESDFVMIPPSGVLEQQTDLTLSYDFCSAAEVTLFFDGYIQAQSDNQPIAVRSNEIAVDTSPLCRNAEQLK